MNPAIVSSGESVAIRSCRAGVRLRHQRFQACNRRGAVCFTIVEVSDRCIYGFKRIAYLPLHGIGASWLG